MLEKKTQSIRLYFTADNRVIEVTNLNESGPRSLREAAETSGPRMVVFKVSGIIDLNGETISITNPYVTIALKDAGASRRIDENGEWVANRGEVDSRIINDYKNGTGFIPVDENEVGGYPVIPFSTPYTDSDHDGMADAWEESHGFDLNSASDNIQDKDGDGYTNIEEFINGTSPNNVENKVVFPTEAIASTNEAITAGPSTEGTSGGSTDRILLLLLTLAFLFRRQRKGNLF